MPLVADIQADIVSDDREALDDDLDAFLRHTRDAADSVDNDLWRAAERIPLAGPNLRAVSATADLAVAVAEGAVAEAAGIDIEAFRPVDGRIDLAALAATAPSVRGADATIDAAREVLDGIDTSALIGPVAAPVTQLRDQLARVGDIVDGLATAADVLPAALGAEGERRYVLVFPNNAELRTHGGALTAFAELTVDGGRIEIAPAVDAAELREPADDEIEAVDGETVALFGQGAATSVDHAAMAFDFATTAQVVATRWQQVTGDAVDGVLSFDPVALGNLLAATGPVTLSDGTELTSENAAETLLWDVYERYPDPFEHDAFYAGASSSIFLAVVNGQAPLPPLVAALAESAQQGRFSIWSADDAEQRLVERTGLAGELENEVRESDVAVAFNDLTGLKLDARLDATVEVAADRCQADETAITVTASLVSSVPAEGLPEALQHAELPEGTTVTRVDVVAPPGFAVDGVRQGAARIAIDDLEIGRYDGRTVVTIGVALAAGASDEVSVRFRAEGVDAPELDVTSTPMIRETPVRVVDVYC
ncbi:DUF4012 domain-containing protein [Microbacterium gilvum]|uniref:DUF4012 domain-containing protein n=1 Tax=Microbacterium gilvum TaxID=1336204 RepID=A0ABP9ABC6_9MICO